MTGGWCAAVLAAFLLAIPAASAGPEQLHVSPTADGRSLVVQWASATPLEPGEASVRWWLHRGDDQVQTEPAELVGTTVGLADAPSTTFHYAATIGPFEPASFVFYQVGAGVDLSLATMTWTPALDKLRLVAYGDVGSDSLGVEGFGGPQFRIQRQVQQSGADLQVILGDLAYESSNTGWDRFMRFMEGSAGSIPTLAAVGNHEWLNDADRYEQFLQRFVLPGDEQNYVVVSGPVRLVVLNSDLVCLSKAPQNVLPAEAPCERGQPNPAPLEVLRGLQPFDGWTIAAFHHPVWSSGPHGLDGEPQVVAVRELWRPLLEQAGVDLVLTAHDHMYERSHQMAGDAVVDQDGVFGRGNGTVYVVSGGGGRELYEFEGEQPAWSASRVVQHHLMVVDATAGGLRVQAVDESGQTLDSFTIGTYVAEPERASQEPWPDIPALAWLPLLVVLALAAVARRRHL